MQPPPQASGRFRAFDGLRGAAAVVVLAHHALLTFSPFAAPYFDQPVVGSFARAMVYSPVHLLWAGTEAVYLFFVLSGFVLVWVARGPSMNWERYFPSRLVRLYLPVAAAVGFAWLTFALWPRTGVGHSMWLDVAPRADTPSMIATDVTLLNGTSGAITPLWSLQWEVLFSLLLPIYVLVSRRLGLLWQLAGAIAVSCSGVYLGNPLLTFLPMFALGAALATNWGTLSSRFLRDRWSGVQHVAWACAVALALVFASAQWVTRSFGDPGWTGVLAHGAVLAGITFLVAATAMWGPLRRVFESRPFQWLGAISFSLYLVHEPIMKAVGFTYPGSVAALLVAVVIAVAVAQAFYLGAERPIHRLARRMRVVPAH